MPLNMNILDSYVMMGLWEDLSPVDTFFKDRYFPTGEGDLFKTKKILVEYRKGNKGMAPFMMRRADPINVNRKGFEIHDYAPVCIKQSRDLYLDQLEELGFGEAILTDRTPEQRDAALVQEDLRLLDDRITRTEELLCATTMINNGFSVDEAAGIADDGTLITGNTATVLYYDPLKGNDGAITIQVGDKITKNSDWDAIVKIIRPMCRSLKRRGLPATDLLVGQDVADVLLNNTVFKGLVNTQSGIIISQPISLELSKYDGVTLIGVINFFGHKLNVICVDEQYEDASGVTQNYFPAKSICVTAPGAGHLMYGAATKMDDNGKLHTIATKRLPDVDVHKKQKMREIWMETYPLAAPKNYSPWIYGANAV